MLFRDVNARFPGENWLAPGTPGRHNTILSDLAPAHAFGQVRPVVDDVFRALILRVWGPVITEVGYDDHFIAAIWLATHPGHNPLAIREIAMDKLRLVDP